MTGRLSFASLFLAALLAFGTATATAAPKPVADEHGAPHAAPADPHATESHAADAHAPAADAHGAEAGHGDAHADDHHGSSNPIVAAYFEELHGVDHEHDPHDVASIFTLMKSYWKKQHKALTKESLANFYYEKAKALGDAEAVAEMAPEVSSAALKRVDSGAGLLANLTYFLYSNSYGVVGLLIIAMYGTLFSWVFRNRAILPNSIGAIGITVVQGFLDFVKSILGSEEEARRYVPFLGTLFFYILACNYMSLVPFLKSPSAVIWNNLGLSLAVFLYCQYIAFTRLGIGGYIYHLMGEPKDAFGWILGVLLIFWLELMGEIIKPVSLALRLFGNILAEDILLLVFVTLGIGIFAVLPFGMGELMPVGIPFHVLLAPLILLFSTIQALVFTFLSAVFISMKIPHHHHDEHDHGHHGDHHGHAHAHAH